jgi:hypothetical protein
MYIEMRDMNESQGMNSKTYGTSKGDRSKVDIFKIIYLIVFPIATGVCAVYVFPGYIISKIDSMKSYEISSTGKIPPSKRNA